MQAFPKMCKQAKGEKAHSPKTTVPSSAAKEKDNFALQEPLSHKDSTIFSVIKQIYIMGSPFIHLSKC